MEADQKKVSVILSSYNAKERLFLALSSYHDQDYPKEHFEVIVVDDGSTDETYKMIRTLNVHYHLKYIRHVKNLGRACARNSGIKAASGEIIIFSDSDMIAEPTFISKHVLHHKKNDNIFVCGSFWNKINKNYNEKKGRYLPPINPIVIKNKQIFKTSSKQAFAQFYESFQEYYGTNLEGFEFPWMYFIVMNCSVKLKHLKRVGLFDEQFKRYGGEDEEMGYRLWKGGLKGIVDPSIKNYHLEHDRSTNQQDDSYQNIHYIIQKHAEINPIMYYFIDFIDGFEKSRLLQDMKNAIKEKIVSPSFEQNCLLLFIHYSRKSKTLQPPSLSLEIKKLRTIKKYRKLAMFLQQLILKTTKR
ncbi:glycosyltransferase family 2 protein [Bacillus aquiflavi]|uniref:Glycosyltransferase family 2 protein n=1 Tax=Bacillus aquiflavi TaxID=2672567 RepID=A0A6B3W115_9BACI|nr:glycosyltransferase family 2 protein [Bacillus aquiflavi]MBA4536919.1 glycosyltransferase family 2 protein [Bacillus aquiflavi]NEY82305.1 glycosyltransferase family 2 protein [Bacillus aquiflavi]UAC47734.1 glycosyltransferase [Bacillus aquiflavi]